MQDLGMGKLKLEQKSTISEMGPAKVIVIQKSNHQLLKENDMLNRKLKVTISLETI